MNSNILLWSVTILIVPRVFGDSVVQGQPPQYQGQPQQYQGQDHPVVQGIPQNNVVNAVRQQQQDNHIQNVNQQFQNDQVRAANQLSQNDPALAVQQQQQRDPYAGGQQLNNAPVRAIQPQQQREPYAGGQQLNNDRANLPLPNAQLSDKALEKVQQYKAEQARMQEQVAAGKSYNVPVDDLNPQEIQRNKQPQAKAPRQARPVAKQPSEERPPLNARVRDPKKAVLKDARRNHLIAQSDECGSDAERLCNSNKNRMRSNLDVLYCLTNEVANDDSISQECHQYLWQYKLNITKDPKFDQVARDICSMDLPTSGCQGMDSNSGKLIPCLLDAKNDIKNMQCVGFLDKMGAIVYQDYRLICNFMEDCESAIRKYHCGRVDSNVRNDSSYQHSQGGTVKCLEEQIVRQHGEGEEAIDDKCAKQIVRLAELTSDDFHLDRNLFFNCKDDRERLCEDVVAGEGRVYICLFQHKFDHMMSQGCREALTLRQQLVANNYKASYNLQKFCSNDITTNGCLDKKYKSPGSVNDHNDILGLSSVLLCLESKLLDGVQINQQCDQYLIDFRQMLMSDYQLSPEIVNNCNYEINELCSGLNKEGETIHCILKNVQERKHISNECQESVMHLIKETEVGSDYRMDPALHSACYPVVQSACRDLREGDPMILSCLMEHLYTDKMTSDCSKRLIELQYFISRDFSLDSVFYKKCHKISQQLCDVGLNNVEHNEDMTMPLSMVLGCLYRNMHDKSNVKKFDRDCAHEVNRVMKNRALNYKLNPELEDACMHDLGELCSDDVPQEGTELICLQDNYENITSDVCRDEIRKLTKIEEEEAGNVEDILIRACEPELMKHCEQYLDGDDEGKIMACLIEKKDELNPQCSAGVTHFQLIQLKDIQFSFNFMKACKNDVENTCPNMQKKSEVVMCLSKQVRDAIVRQTAHSVTDECIAQLNTENLQKHENIKLNVELYKACKSDLKQYCLGVKAGHGQMIDCLKEHPREHLTHECGQAVYGLEKEEAQNRKLDYTLMKTCKENIKKHCMNHLKTGDSKLILDCLITHKDKLDRKCRDVVKSREKLEFSDINLNPVLKSECLKDIEKHCNEELKAQKEDEEENHIFQGRVIECLKDKHAAPEVLLSPSCANHISQIEGEQAQDYQLHPALAMNCIDAINQFCQPEKGNVVECLKDHYTNEKLMNHQACTVEIARLLNEGRTDIQADPVLHEACINDINMYCSGIREGQGRVMSCLLFKMKNAQLTPQCYDHLVERQTMWQYAVKKQQIGNMEDLSALLLDSPHKSYLLSWITVFLVCILVMGMLCGRATKRISRDRKAR